MTQVGPGRLVLVIGPSGAGKDTLIEGARRLLAGDPTIVFSRRSVTRPPAAGEDHEPVTPARFEQLAASGAFALHWRAHGLGYGIPRRIDADLARGCTVIVNVSRTIVPTARRLYPRRLILYIDARPELRAARIAGRGREVETDIKQRLDRNPGLQVDGDDVVRIDNSTSVEAALDTFLRAIAKDRLAHT